MTDTDTGTTRLQRDGRNGMTWYEKALVLPLHIPFRPTLLAETTRLESDPHIQGMAADLTSRTCDLSSWTFSVNAIEEYESRSGKVSAVAGAPAEAIRRLVQRRESGSQNA